MSSTEVTYGTQEDAPIGSMQIQTTVNLYKELEHPWVQAFLAWDVLESTPNSQHEGFCSILGTLYPVSPNCF